MSLGFEASATAIYLAVRIKCCRMRFAVVSVEVPFVIGFISLFLGLGSRYDGFRTLYLCICGASFPSRDTIQ